MRRNSRRNARKQALVLCLFAAAFVFAGCEDNAEDYQYNESPSVQPLVITPSRSFLSATNSYTVFHATGGARPYGWIVSDAALGSVPNVDADAVTYTRVDGAQGINVVTVFDKNNWVAEAEVEQE